MTTDTTWVEYLTPAQCWELLAATPVGRVGVVVAGAPEIYPVNHLRDGESIVFRTDPGTKLAGLAASPAVCFQVDGIDTTGETGWSVLVKGHADQIHDTTERARIDAIPLRHWALGPKVHWIRIAADDVTGRCIHHGDDPAPAAPPDGARPGAMNPT